MPKLNHLELYKVLEKTNCRQCGAPTCLAFAAAVLRGEKNLNDCPFLDKAVVEKLGGLTEPRRPERDDWEQALGELQDRIQSSDLSSMPDRLGAVWLGDKLAVKCLGKDFCVDQNGNMTSACHNNRWVAVPLLHYIIDSAGLEPGRNWVHLKELSGGGATWAGLFAQRCEKPLKELVDKHTDLFELIVDIFEGKPAAGFDSDISVVIHPLPKVPVLICYWKKEADLDSSLSLFFDSTASANLDVGSLYTLGVGLLTMFEKIVLTHGKRA
ncbi:MAG: DUF3786 domain-containing protein [Syntrophobacteraceae bacterium]|nr:DUF3786 domain-containing protein [Syntrophobacteraceae bacterium]